MSPRASKAARVSLTVCWQEPVMAAIWPWVSRIGTSAGPPLAWAVSSWDRHNKSFKSRVGTSQVMTFSSCSLR